MSQLPHPSPPRAPYVCARAARTSVGAFSTMHVACMRASMCSVSDISATYVLAYVRVYVRACVRVRPCVCVCDRLAMGACVAFWSSAAACCRWIVSCASACAVIYQSDKCHSRINAIGIVQALCGLLPISLATVFRQYLLRNFSLALKDVGSRTCESARAGGSHPQI